MPRRSSGGRPSAPSPIPKSSPPPPPATVNRAPPPVSAGGALAGAAMDGLAFGTGSAIAHRAVDGVMGPRVIHHESPSQAGGYDPTAAEMDPCTQQIKAFQDCIQSNSSDIGRCQFYVDMLGECRRGSTLRM